MPQQMLWHGGEGDAWNAPAAEGGTHYRSGLWGSVKEGVENGGGEWNRTSLLKSYRSLAG